MKIVYTYGKYLMVKFEKTFFSFFFEKSILIMHFFSSCVHEKTSKIHPPQKNEHFFILMHICAPGNGHIGFVTGDPTPLGP